MTSQINLDPETVRSIAAAAIFEQIGEESREKVLQQAVQFLLTPKKGDRYTYGADKTPLQLAFDEAISQVTREVVKDKIAEDPRIKAKIEELLGPVVMGVLEESSAVYDLTLSDKIGQAFGDYIAEISRENRDSRR